MDRTAFDETLRLLGRECIGVRSSRYDDHILSSWRIELATEKPIRIVWNAREQRAAVQEKPRPWEPWQDQWNGHGREEQTPKKLIQVVQDLRSGRPPGRFA